MKERIDILLVERRLVESRTKAQWLIKNGYVFVSGKKITKPGRRIDNSLKIQLTRRFPYVGRGGLKLEAALRDFSVSVEGKICIDIGASVGGFTDCLIKHGAKKVYAIDTATDLLHPSLSCEKMNGKVIPILSADARNSLNIDEKADICTIDVTFTSLKAILPNIKNLLKNSGDIIVLVKPIFETEFQNKGRFDNIEDPITLFQILNDLIQWSIKNQFYPYEVIKSPLLGKEDSIEFFIHLKLKESGQIFDFKKKIKNILKLNHFVRYN